MMVKVIIMQKIIFFLSSTRLEENYAKGTRKEPLSKCGNVSKEMDLFLNEVQNSCQKWLKLTLGLNLEAAGEGFGKSKVQI